MPGRSCIIVLLLLLIAGRSMGQERSIGIGRITVPEGHITLKSVLDSLEHATGYYVHYPPELAELSDSCICSRGMVLTYDEILKAFLRGGWIVSHYKHTIWIRRRKPPL